MPLALSLLATTIKTLVAPWPHATGTPEAALSAFQARLREVGQQLDGAKAASRQTDDNLGHSIDQVGRGGWWLWACRWVGRCAPLPRAMQVIPEHRPLQMGLLRDKALTNHATLPRCQVARELSGAAEGQRMKREQIGRNATKASELQAQVGAGRGTCGHRGSAAAGWLQLLLRRWLQLRSGA